MEIPFSPEDLMPLQPWIIFMASAIWVGVSLTRVRVFDGQPLAKVGIALCMGFFATTSIQMTHWDTLITVTSWAIPAGLAGTMIYKVALQRGRTEKEDQRRHEERMRRPDRS